MNAHQIAVLSGGMFGLSAVGLGAIGTHSLILTVSEKAAWTTAVDYQMWHALVLLVIPLMSIGASRTLTVMITSYIAGTFLFSGSIYLLVLTKNLLWGPLTPLGGSCILLGWVLLIWSLWLHRENLSH